METWVKISDMRWWLEPITVSHESFEINEFLKNYTGKSLYQTELAIFADGIHLKFDNIETATLFKLKFT